MPFDVMLVVLFGALLHAGWNTAIKSGRDTFQDAVLVASGGAAVAVAALPFLPLPLPASWPFVAASAVIHVAYFALVAAAYRAGDMSFTYPLMRGAAPLLVALASGPLLAEHIEPMAWAGVLLVSGGILGLTLVYRRPGRPILAPAGFALGNAVVIATYTFVDGVGVRLSGGAMAYTACVFLFTALPLLAFAMHRRPGSFALHLRAYWRLGLFGGVCSFASYALALWAMTQAPIAPVAALRETSILFAMGLAALVLKERFGIVRSIAAASVAAGVITLRLA